MNTTHRSTDELLDTLAAAVQELPRDRQQLLDDIMLRQAYSADEAAEMLGVHVRTIWRAIQAGNIRAIRIGDTERAPVRIPAEELIRLLQDGRYERG